MVAVSKSQVQDTDYQLRATDPMAFSVLLRERAPTVMPLNKSHLVDGEQGHSLLEP